MGGESPNALMAQFPAAFAFPRLRYTYGAKKGFDLLPFGA
jgi:hypothetical protein